MTQKHDESAWLIELRADNAPSVWLGKCGWTSPEFAIRFAREQDARDAYSIFARVPSPNVVFTEHVWCAPDLEARTVALLERLLRGEHDTATGRVMQRPEQPEPHFIGKKETKA